MADALLIEPTNRREAAAMLTGLLDVQPTAPSLWRGQRRPGGVGRVFGGQVVAQALVAAQKSVADARRVHSLHAYFLRGGDEDHPIDYRVEADMDGASFSNRRVVALQRDRPILNLIASFQRPEEGLSHQQTMPVTPLAETLPDQTDFLSERVSALPPAARWLLSRASPVEFRSVSLMPFLQQRPTEAVSSIWFRLAAPIVAPLAMHQAVLAYASDFALISTALLPHDVHGRQSQIQGASLDHAVWFHEPFDANEWLLYHTYSPWTGHARGLSLGSIYTAEGRLVASTAQEGLMRLRPPNPTLP